MKKCPICYSILPSKVIFCPICGTELQTQISETPATTQTSHSPPLNNPVQRQVFRDEPIETMSIDTEYSSTNSQFAWKISDSMIPFKMKGQIKYIEHINLPKLKLNPFINMKFHEALLISVLGFINTVLLMIQIGIVGVIVLYPQSILISKISLLITTVTLSCLITYILNRQTAKILAKDANFDLSKVKRNIPSFLFTHGIHLLFIGVITVVCIKLVSGFSSNLFLNSSIYTLAILLILMISLISPTFKIAKLFTSIRDSSVFQNFHDALQLPKFSIKRSVEFCIFSFVLPSSIMLIGVNSILRIITVMTQETTQLVVTKWNLFLIILVLLLLTINVIYVTVTDVRSFLYYEDLIKKNIAPPDINWVNLTGDELLSSMKKETTSNQPVSEKDKFFDREERCPSCSTILVEGAEFCTDCGKKVVR